MLVEIVVVLKSRSLSRIQKSIYSLQKNPQPQTYDECVQQILKDIQKYKPASEESIGAKRKDILTQFLIESIVLTVSGGIIGILVGVSLSFIITRFLPIPFILEPVAIVLAVGVSTIVGIVFGIYPAQRAAKLSPIDALRYE